MRGVSQPALAVRAGVGRRMQPRPKKFESLQQVLNASGQQSDRDEVVDCLCAAC